MLTSFVCLLVPVLVFFFFLLCSRGLVLAMLFLAVHLVQLNSCLLFGVALDFGDVCVSVCLSVCLFVRVCVLAVLFVLLVIVFVFLVMFFWLVASLW